MRICLKSGRIINLHAIESVDPDGAAWRISYESGRQIALTGDEYMELIIPPVYGNHPLEESERSQLCRVELAQNGRWNGATRRPLGIIIYSG